MGLRGLTSYLFPFTFYFFNLDIDLAGEGQFAGVADAADGLKHREHVGVGMGENYKVEVCAVVLVIIFNIKCG